MTLLQFVLLFLAAVLGGALNSVAGGGSFITFPSLIFAGTGAKIANATSTVALWPGSVASATAYRKELASLNRLLLMVLVGTSLVGGVLGAILLLRTSQSTFVQLIPYLLLLATLLFAFSGPITSLLRKRAQATQKTHLSWLKLASISLVQFVVATYGGYFGGGIGIMMLASLGLMGMENIHEMNALKTVLQASINGVAVITFIIAGAVVWPQAIIMILGGIAGGFAGAYYARKLDQRLVRAFVILVGTGLTIYFFLK
jgi:uncharacterized membrane protein YfcA